MIGLFYSSQTEEEMRVLITVFLGLAVFALLIVVGGGVAIGYTTEWVALAEGDLKSAHALIFPVNIMCTVLLLLMLVIRLFATTKPWPQSRIAGVVIVVLFFLSVFQRGSFSPEITTTLAIYGSMVPILQLAIFAWAMWASRGKA